MITDLIFIISMMIIRRGKVSWDGLDGLTDCPALPSLPYLLHRLLGGHQDDQDDEGYRHQDDQDDITSIDDEHHDNMPSLTYLSHRISGGLIK